MKNKDEYISNLDFYCKILDSDIKIIYIYKDSKIKNSIYYITLVNNCLNTISTIIDCNVDIFLINNNNFMLNTYMILDYLKTKIRKDKISKIKNDIKRRNNIGIL